MSKKKLRPSVDRQPKAGNKYRFSDLVKGPLKPGAVPAGIPPLPSELRP